MKPARLSLVALVVLLGFVATVSFANEDTKSNPYESIAARNPFQLNPPPPPQDPNEVAKPPPPPLATVEVTGVLNMPRFDAPGLTKKLVLLEIVPGPGKPPLKQTLQEGERVDAVEVLSIDVDEGNVKLNNGGVITNIALRTPTKAPVGPAGPVPGVQPGFPPPVLQPGTTAGFVPPTANPNVANPNAYDRGNVMVVGGTPTQATPTSSGVIAKPYGAYGAGAPAVGGSPAYGSQPGYGGASGVNVTGGGDLRTIPSRPIRTNPQSTATPDQTRNDPAQQYINMAIQKQQNESRRIPMPPLPPIPGFDPNQ
jgi:hypothetical protein